jgi:hypothetical protein
MPSLAEDWDTLCAICASADYRGDLRLRHVEHGPGGSIDIDDLENVCLCNSCFGYLRSALRTATQRDGSLEHWPTLPLRHSSTPADGDCEICCKALAPSWVMVELASGTRVFTAPLLRLGERPQKARTCESCLRWFRGVIDEESVGRWTSRRGVSVDRPGGRQQRALHCHGVGLLPRDEAALRDTLQDLGHSYRDTGSAQGENPDIVIIAADAFHEGATTEFTPEILERTVVVASEGRAEAALEFMRAGARDLLVSPLSRQQVMGALDRLADPDAFAGRDAATGLPSYRPEPRFGLPCHLLAVEPPDETDPLDIFLTLRRFLRGYDRVGLDGDSLVPLIVYCPDDDLARVLERIQGVLGDDVPVRLLASINGAVEPDPEMVAAEEAARMAGSPIRICA